MSKGKIIIISFCFAIALICGIWAYLKFGNSSNTIQSTNDQNTSVSTYSTNTVTPITKRSTNESFTFAIEADPHMDENSSEDVYKQTLNQIVSSKPDFLIDLGDTFMTDKLDQKTPAKIEARYVLMKGYFDLLGSIPLYLVKGNHDGEAGWDDNILKTNSTADRLKYFPSSNTKTYYSFESGNVLFVMLDPYLYTTTKPNADGWKWTLGKEQYDWLKTTLESSKASYKLVFIHQLVGGDDQGRGGIEFAKYYEWGGNNFDGTYGFDTYRSGWGKPIHQLLIDNHVSAVFKGHDHFYAKQELDGIIYQTLPQPSHAGDTITKAQYGYLNGDIIGGSGFLKVAVSKTQVDVSFIKADGSLGASYTIK